MKSPLVSIIVPCYKQAEYLPEALESVISQTYDNWECLIIDDGSPNNTGEIACRYCKARLFGAENCEWNLEEYSYDSMLWHNMIFCSSIFKRKDYLKTIGYNPNMVFGWEDWDFWLSLLEKDDKSIDLFYYRIKERSIPSKVTNLSVKHMCVR